MQTFSKNEASSSNKTNGEIPLAAHYLSEYVQQDSITGTEQKAGRYFSNLCKDKGLHIHTFDDELGRYNFSASLYPLEHKKPNILFLNHIDVVEAGDESDWKYPPFSGEIAEDCVWGRGAYDNKGAAMMQFMAVSHFVGRANKEDLPFNVTLLAVSGEEVFSDEGAKAVATKHLEFLNPTVVIGEGPVGTNNVVPSHPDAYVFGISVAHKRCMWLKLVLDIQANGHGSVPPKVYAIKSMVKALDHIANTTRPLYFNRLTLNAIRAIGEMEGGVKGSLLKNINWVKPLAERFIRKDPGLTSLFADTITITGIQSDSKAANKISKSVRAILDCRLMPDTDTEEFLAFIRKTLKNQDIQIEVLKETPNATPTPAQNFFYEALDKAIRNRFGNVQVVPMLLPATVDSNHFRSLGVPTFSVVPAKMPRALLDCIHAPNERIPIQALIDGPEVFIDFLNQVFHQES